MRILLVEDNEMKRLRVRQVLSEELDGVTPEVVEAINYEQALQALAATQYDLVVLDLLLPGAGHGPSAESSRALIDAVLKGTATITPMHILGLTAFPEIAEEEREYYDANLFALEMYSDIDLTWAKRIRSKIRYLSRSKQAAAAFQENNYDFDLVILVARYDNEFKPIRSKLLRTVDTTMHPRWPGEIAIGAIKVPGDRTLRAAICCIGEMGMAPAATIAAQAIAVFRPRLLAMLGMCCGFESASSASPRKMMDAIVVREVNCWEEGRYVESAKKTSEFKNRARARFVDDQIRSQLERAIESAVDTLHPALDRYTASAEYRKIRTHFGEEKVRSRPDVQFSPLVSGSSVIADENVVAEILDRHPNALGLDMEIYGVYTAADKAVGAKPAVLAIKGVADHGTKDKDDAAQKGASTVSAVVLLALLPHLKIW